MRRTKIICTLGPAVDSEDKLEALILSGMNVARINFSHGSHEEQLIRVNRFKKLRDKHSLPIALLLDTKGPEIRLGRFKEYTVNLIEGQSFWLKHDDILGDSHEVSISHKELYKDIVPGARILVNDGLVALEVKRINDKDIECTVLNSGVVSNNKGVNVPDIDTHLPSLTEKDINDIRFGVENGFDIIASSFVRKASDVLATKELLDKFGGRHIKVVAKIENREGLTNFDEILEACDGIMVARGDLGVEIPIEQLPATQKMMIEKCFKAGKPVITATQMLDSMIKNPRPTRAEVTDVANALYDGTSAIMLSGETAAGDYPVESLKTMARIAECTEKSDIYWSRMSEMKHSKISTITDAVSHATCTSAIDLDASAIVVFTKSGQTARMVSRFRPLSPIIATTTSKIVQRQLALSWGVFPVFVEEVTSTDHMFDIGIKKALEMGLVRKGDIIVITAGTPVSTEGTTNTMKVLKIE